MGSPLQITVQLSLLKYCVERADARERPREFLWTQTREVSALAFNNSKEKHIHKVGTYLLLTSYTHKVHKYMQPEYSDTRHMTGYSWQEPLHRPYPLPPPLLWHREMEATQRSATTLS